MSTPDPAFHMTWDTAEKIAKAVTRELDGTARKASQKAGLIAGPACIDIDKMEREVREGEDAAALAALKKNLLRQVADRRNQVYADRIAKLNREIAEAAERLAELERRVERLARSADWFKPTTLTAPNPLPTSVDWPLVESVLGIKIVQSRLQSEVVHPAPLGERQGDLLGAEADEVDGSSEFPNLLRLRVVLEQRGLCGADGDVAPGFVQGFATGQHDDSSTSVVGASEGTAHRSPAASDAPSTPTGQPVTAASPGPDSQGSLSGRKCQWCGDPATERVVYKYAAEPQGFARALCDRHLPQFARSKRAFGATIVGLTDVDEGPLGWLS